MKKALLLTLTFALFATFGFSQTDKFWSSHTDVGKIPTAKAVARLTFPKEFKLFDLNLAPLRQELFTITDNKAKKSTVISLPNVDGQLEQFEVFEASNFEPALQARFPEIRAFSGKGITDRHATLKLSISPQGVQTMVFRTEKENEFLEPYSADRSVYAVFKSSRSIGNLPWTCSTEDRQAFSDINAQISSTNRPTSNAGEMRTLRLAQSCNGEYSNYFGAFNSTQVALVLAGYNATLTRCNGCYEKDLAVHLNLIANTADVIYYDPATDPYTTLANWNSQLQTTLNNVIGAANYDIGHMFGASGGGGNAGCIGCVCGTNKGSGITSPADGIPEGDNFDIDYVVHEVGHQLGALHTFSFDAAQIGSQSKEVASGITIMAYAGIVSGLNAAAHSLDYYHATSIDQIQANLATKTCPITTNISAANATPVVAPVPNYTIPISTPFAITGSATDANPGDVLSYAWEQNDPATSASTGNNSVASATKLTGPNFLSFPVSNLPTRTFPRIQSILAGATTTSGTINAGNNINIEALSSVSRTLNFRLTVRDNCPYVPGVKIGQTSFTDMVVTVTNTSGPFQVTQPNTNLSWPASSAQTVTWNVAGTTGAPVSCADVRILLSVDGGFTWPFTLSAGTANDGTELINIPAVPPTTTARVKVESVGNIFFDISNTNFSITTPVSGFNFSATTPTTISCNGPATADVNLGTTAVGGFSTPIVLTATAGVPAGTTVSFSPNPLAPGSATTVTLNNANTLANGTYNITVTGTAGAVVQTATITYIVSAGAGPAITAQPTNVTVCEGAAASFSVTATGVSSYQWQVNTGSGFTNIAGATTATYNIAATTAAQNGSSYHCVLVGQCGTTTSADATLTVQTAPAITSQPANTTACAGSSATFTVAATGTNITYQWQISTTGCGGPWTDIPTATTNSFTVSGITVGMSGNAYHVVISGTCAPVITSSCAILTVGNAAAITSQPVNTTVCAGQNASFSVTATGTVSSYQWQVNTGSGFVDMPGETNPTLTLNAVTVAMNGNQYQVNVFSCTAIPITSSVATLTVNTPVSIGTQPAASTLCLGGNTSFTVAATGTGLSYQWQYAPTCGGAFTNIAGATAATLNLNAVTLANAGAYQVVVTGTCNTVTSSCVTLTVNSPITISAQPVDVDLCLPGNTASFSVTAAGTGLTYQWQVNDGTGWVNMTGETNATLTITGITTTALDGNQYRVVLNGTCTTGLNSDAATLAVNSPVDITTQPADISTCAGSTTSFSVVATGSTITYQWQVSINGGPFINVTNAAPFSGATTSTLSINPASTSLTGYEFRVIVSGVPCGAVTSNVVSLTVNALPVAVLTAAAYTNITPYIRTTLYTTVSPAGSYSYQWYRDGVLVPALNDKDKFAVTVDDFGSYDVIVTDNVTGCASGLSNKATVDYLSSTELFIYPNPSSGSFQVRYFSSTTTARTLNIYDSKGARVYTKSYPISTPYTRMDVNMDNAASDIYLVELKDASGKRIATGKVVIR